MNAPFKILAAAVCGLLLGLPAAQADDSWDLQVDDYAVQAGPLSLADTSAREIFHFVYVGTWEDELTIYPHELVLQVGKPYQLVVSNPSKQIHVVAAPELAATVKTAELELIGRKLAVAAPALDMGTGITMQPGQTIAWMFTPLSEGVYKFGCDDPVHAAAGMHTMIKVTREEVL